jgi:hypothetical protein
MFRRWILAGGIGLILVVFWGLHKTPVPFIDLVKQPLHALWGSHRQLRTGVLDVSEHISSVEEATWRLLKPFGSVRLIRRVPAPAPENPPPPPSTR